MKKVLTIVAVSLLVSATLFAGVSFSGRFRQGYVFGFGFGDDAKNTISTWKTEEAKVSVSISDDNGVWKVTLKSPGALDSNDKWAANASVNVDKIVKAAGGDMGDLTMSVSFGNNGKLAALSAYSDPTGNEYYKMKTNGTESIQIAMAYAKLFKLNVGVDPTFNDTKDASFIISASTEPVSGLAIGVGYTLNGYQETGYGSKTEYGFNQGINGSVNVDLGKMLDMDFDLGLTAYDTFALGAKDAASKVIDDSAKDNLNTLAGGVYGGVDAVDGYVEVVMTTDMPDGGDATNKMGLNACVNLNLVDNLGLDVYFNIGDFDAVADTIKVGGDVSYKIAGVQVAANVEYLTANKTLKVTPKMIINF